MRGTKWEWCARVSARERNNGVKTKNEKKKDEWLGSAIFKYYLVHERGFLCRKCAPQMERSFHYPQQYKMRENDELMNVLEKKRTL
jgi:hypothetical protein